MARDGPTKAEPPFALRAGGTRTMGGRLQHRPRFKVAAAAMAYATERAAAIGSRTVPVMALDRARVPRACSCSPQKAPLPARARAQAGQPSLSARGRLPWFESPSAIGDHQPGFSIPKGVAFPARISTPPGGTQAVDPRRVKAVRLPTPSGLSTARPLLTRNDKGTHLKL